MKIKQKLVEFLRDEEGLTMVEYVVAGALVAAGAGAAFAALGGKISSEITDLQTWLEITAKP